MNKKIIVDKDDLEDFINYLVSISQECYKREAKVMSERFIKRTERLSK